MIMNFRFVILPTDFLIYILILSIIIYAAWTYTKEPARAPWRRVLHNQFGVIAAVILCFYAIVGVLDSIHLRQELPLTNNKIQYSTEIESVLDLMLAPLGDEVEKTYSAPFATQLYSKESMETADGKIIRTYPSLDYGGIDLKKLNRTKTEDIIIRSLQGIGYGIVIALIFTLVYLVILAIKNRRSIFKISKMVLFNQGVVRHRLVLLTVTLLFILIAIALELSKEYHIFGTDKVGHDVFYHAIKSIRTGLIIGTLTTLIMLPFALMLGTMAGYFGGIIDDIIQYIYTTLSSIPGVLLIAASILSVQIFISNHASLFPSVMQQADARLLALCAILGITSWTSLCRLLRGETLKLREMDYVQAAIALGVGKYKILTRHIMPNVMHIVIISVVLDFSGLVLAEAILSYVGVGVDPSTHSWGNMINSARLELAREPLVWWPLAAAFVFMFVLVLSANIFSDAVRDAFDPRTRIAPN